MPFHQPSCLGRKARGLTVVTRAGPSTTQYVFAFVLPLSLLALTVFASVKVSDKLDRDFLEEVCLCLFFSFLNNLASFVHRLGLSF